MILEGSCHCGSVRFSLRSAHPHPFNLCYCSICRKTAGGGGYAINLDGDFESLKVDGRGQIEVYRARIREAATGQVRTSPGERSFCRRCGTALWVWDPRWPALVHPFASAIDTELPIPPQRTHLMLAGRPRWVIPRTDPRDRSFSGYPDESIAEWHERNRLVDED